MIWVSFRLLFRITPEKEIKEHMEKLHLLFNTVNFLKLLFKITFPLLPTTEEFNRSVQLLKRSFLGVYF